MANEPNELRHAIIRRLRTKQEKDVILANNLLGEVTRYLFQMRSRVEEETRVHLMSLDQPLNHYGLHTLAMTGESDTRITTALGDAREEVMRSINEKTLLLPFRCKVRFWGVTLTINLSMAKLSFYDYHNMVAILEKTEHDTDFYQIVDFFEASHIRYALTVHPTIYVSHIRQFWSTTRVETIDGETKVLAKEMPYMRRLSTVTSLDAGQDSLQRQHSFMEERVQSQDLEITQLKTRVKTLEDNKKRREGFAQGDAPNTGEGGMDQGEDLLESKRLKRPRIQLGKESFKKLKTAEASKETCSTTEVTDKKEKELWVELKRLYELYSRDPLWALQRYMHDPLVWRLYDTCGIHHVSTGRGHEIFMLVEKDYSLTKGLTTLMLCNKLQVDQQSKMSGGDVFDLIGDVDPTDEDGDIGRGDSIGVSASLDGEIFLGGKKCQESNIGDSDNTRDGGKIVAGIGDSLT
uniref:Uncharacterized protein n=1 Tax=Tanacetum cinerariifolium TaxID=118510 RepID=A0A6L2LBH1_TANCI|nr:hypothetical protein [Tanacetum cinerariifolium]